MADCHPLPRARKPATTSGSSRSLMACLVTASRGLPGPTGRKRIASPAVISLVSGSAAIPARMAASSSSVGRIIPGLSFGIAFDLLLGGLAQADNAARVAPVGKHDAIQAKSDKAVSDHSGLAIPAQIIFEGPQCFPFDLPGFRQRKAMPLKILGVLGWIEGDVHKINVPPFNRADKEIFGGTINRFLQQHWAGRMLNSWAQASDKRLGHVSIGGADRNQASRSVQGRTSYVQGETPKDVRRVLCRVISPGRQRYLINANGAPCNRVHRSNAMAQATNTINPSTPILSAKNGRAIVTSLRVAEHFGKRHANVIRAIKNLKCSPEFNALNFEPAEYVDEQNKPRPMVEMTRDGFTIIAMGFTGPDAVAWKEKYIAAFNAMEAELRGSSDKHDVQPVPPLSREDRALRMIRDINTLPPDAKEEVMTRIEAMMAVKESARSIQDQTASDAAALLHEQRLMIKEIARLSGEDAGNALARKFGLTRGIPNSGKSFADLKADLVKGLADLFQKANDIADGEQKKTETTHTEGTRRRSA